MAGGLEAASRADTADLRQAEPAADVEALRAYGEAWTSLLERHVGMSRAVSVLD
jgi:hypothetical protein